MKQNNIIIVQFELSDCMRPFDMVESFCITLCLYMHHHHYHQNYHYLHIAVLCRTSWLIEKKKFFIPKTFSCLVYCHVQGVFNVVYPHPELVGPWLFHQEPCLLSLCFPSYWDFLNRPKELRLQDITPPVSQFFSTCRMTLRVFNRIYHSSYCYTEPFEYSLLLWNYSDSYFILLK